MLITFWQDCDKNQFSFNRRPFFFSFAVYYAPTHESRTFDAVCQVWGKSKPPTFLRQKACNNRWAKSEKQATVNLKRSHQFPSTHVVRAARARGRHGWIRESISPIVLTLHGSVCATRHAGNTMATGSVWKRLGSPDCTHIFVFSTAPLLNWSGITLEAGRSSLPVRIG